MDIPENRLICTSIEKKALHCLRGKTVEQLIQAFDVKKKMPIKTFFNETETWVPILDGEFLEKQPTLQFEHWAFVHVEAIIGLCTDDGTAYAPLPGPTDIFNATRYFIGTMISTPNLEFVRSS